MKKMNNNNMKIEPGFTMGRVYYLDHIRYLMVLFVVIFHAAISYCHIVPWWYVLDDNRGLLYDIIVLICDIFMMPILFFIAGYFAVPSFHQKGFVGFLKAKMRRLCAPWFIGVITVPPVVHYFFYKSRSIAIDPITSTFWNFWQSFVINGFDFHSGELGRSMAQFSQAHLWFLSLLMIFLILLGIYLQSQRRWPMIFFQRTILNKKPVSPQCVLLMMLFLTSFGHLMVSLIISTENTWYIVGSVVQFQPSRAIVYIFYFIFGAMTFNNQWYKTYLTKKKMWGWGGIFFINALLTLVLSERYYISAPESLSIKILFSCIRSLACLSFFMFILSFAYLYWNKTNKINQLLSKSSYHVYLLHLIIVVYFQFIFKDLIYGFVFLKFIGISTISILISLLISHFFIQRQPIISTIGMMVGFVALFFII